MNQPQEPKKGTFSRMGNAIAREWKDVHGKVIRFEDSVFKDVKGEIPERKMSLAVKFFGAVSGMAVRKTKQMLGLAIPKPNKKNDTKPDIATITREEPCAEPAPQAVVESLPVQAAIQPVAELAGEGAMTQESMAIDRPNNNQNDMQNDKQYPRPNEWQNNRDKHRMERRNKKNFKAG